MKRVTSIAFTAVLLLASVLIFSVAAPKPRGIPNWDDDEDTGIHGSWAYAYIYAVWNTVLEKYQQHDRDHDWWVFYPQPGYSYRAKYNWNYDPYYPFARTRVQYSYQGGDWTYTGADAYASLAPL